VTWTNRQTCRSAPIPTDRRSALLRPVPPSMCAFALLGTPPARSEPLPVVGASLGPIRRWRGSRRRPSRSAEVAPRQGAAPLERSPVEIRKVGERSSETARLAGNRTALDHPQECARTKAEPSNLIGWDAPVIGHDEILPNDWIGHSLDCTVPRVRSPARRGTATDGGCVRESRPMLLNSGAPLCRP
jgi:hypothetical protein